MSNDSSSAPISVPPSSTRPRRASFASGLGFPDFRANIQGGGGPGSMANAVAGAQTNQGRRLSITTLGLSGSPTQTSPFAGRGLRHGSVSSSVGSNPVNPEEAITDDGENFPPSASPNSPFARRVSFGAQALRDARGGSIGNGRYPSSGSPVTGGRRYTASSGSTHSIHGSSGSSPASTIKVFSQNDRSNPSWRHTGEGFNWSEALRTRAERGPVSPNTTQGYNSASMGHQNNYHQRAASIASMEHPSREMPKNPKQNKPDFFQEKILRGDFMD